MGNVTVVGAQWGDEGKGKVVDWLSNRADVVVRFQGGHNAGHTLVIGNETFKLSLLPSGVVRPGKLSVIGNGVVVDPWVLLHEINALQARGIKITPETLLLADNASLILPVHGALDRMREATRGQNYIGTTGRGIGPAYEDKIARRAIRVCDLAEPDLLRIKIDELLLHHNALLRGLGVEEVKGAALFDQLSAVTERLLPFSGVVWQRLDELHRNGRRILFEGAQGAMLDIDHGTYPFVTSSNTGAAQAALGSGFGLPGLGFILGITKAYTTRVGAGPFPTEQDNKVGRLLGERGHEFGTVTGRRRRCGWFDAVLVHQAVKTIGIQGIALTKLDVLDGLDSLNVCVGYRLHGKNLNYLPAAQRAQTEIEPVYETMTGWVESTRGAQSWTQLPATAVKYVRRIEELIETPISLLSTSPERRDVIMIRDPFTD